ncbi:two-component sensor protein histidine protein kinase [Arthroderma uncinatum]|uniref:two-component sensor protein histidine protein kinase n=1 Tax=Arthroderma uncinatum TaxID=74035 RepID=UPI00144A590B|nr:two-component sensor protein histidine protein kinase [Arthroderma uncinatum]KAF3491203.1 two-component sensor protein histidine protein kinase [Arthroderma uncinatum]
MMEENRILGEDLQISPDRLFERLSQLPGYSWDQNFVPIHSSYDHWHFTGIKYSADSETTSTQTASSSSRSKTSISSHNSPELEPRSFFPSHWRKAPSEADSEITSPRDEVERPWLPVIARVSGHVVRLEREFHILRSIIETSDPECKHTVRPIDIIHLARQPEDRGLFLVTIYEYVSPNYLRKLIPAGPASFQMDCVTTSNSEIEKVPLPTFFNFAIGACECLELLHYGLKTVHGEIRGDAFHFAEDTKIVRLMNAGNGARSFDNALGDGWAVLSKEIGVRNKLQFIAPEQTGRLPTEPDSRTDIYALGILLWIMLAGRPAFEGKDLVEVVQNVLSKNLSPISSLRLDVPDACAAVIQRMTKKQIGERYHTISAVKWDFQQISKLLGDGDADALKKFQVAQRDVSSFFTLPCGMFGRKMEFDRIMSVVNKAYKRRQAAVTPNKTSLYTRSSNSSISGDRVDNVDIDASSDSGSLGVPAAAPAFRHNSTSHPLYPSAQDSIFSTESGTMSTKTALLSNRMKSPTDSRMSWENIERDSPSLAFDSGSLARRKAAHTKYRHGGRCEVITVSGPTGMGKSDLIQRLLPEIRKVGYVAVAKVDRQCKLPFDPILKALTSLLRQIFSERDITTEYHNSIRATLQPIWGSLYQFLDLPYQLLFQENVDYEPTMHQRAFQPLKGLKEDIEESFGVSGSEFTSLSQGQSSQDFCQGPASSLGINFVDIMIDVLRIMSLYEVICICVDNAHFVDEESAGLLLEIMKNKLRCVIILTGRSDDIVSPTMKSLFEMEAPNLTRVVLEPLNEDDILEFVAATMHQPANSAMVPLAAVVQEKSCGNPFYARLILETCYRKNCIWYSWRDAAWQFDLDRVFSEFVVPGYGEGVGTNFVVKRLQEMPSAARSIVLWAALLGTTFSFSLVQKLLSGEFLYEVGGEDKDDVTCPAQTKWVQDSSDIVAGLQFLLQAYIIIPGDTDDEFRFSSDHYAQAVASMRQCHNSEKMHFIIIQTMMKYLPDDDTTLHAKARHISLSSRLIKERIPIRTTYRDVLYRAGLAGYKSGAKATALKNYQQCIFLLQDNAWDADTPDAYYDETRELYIQTAEMHLALGQTAETLDALNVIFKNARTAPCKARAWTLRSRVHSVKGNICAALDALFTCLEELGVKVNRVTTWEENDTAFKELAQYLRTVDFDTLLSRPLSEDRSVIAVGAVMNEAISVCLWLDPLMFLRLTVEMMRITLKYGSMVQAVYLYSQFSALSLSRFKDKDLGLKLSDAALSILRVTNDPSAIARGITIHNVFINHMREPVAITMPLLETSTEAAFFIGDRYYILLNVSSMVITRLVLGYDLGEIEALCNDATEGISDWSHDIRGGTAIVAVRQAARALQGKTIASSADLVLSDAHHDDQTYQAEIMERFPGKPHVLLMYRSVLFIPLYAYGHYAKIVELGTEMAGQLHGIWSSRLATQAYFYLSMATLSLHLEDPQLPGVESSISAVEGYKKEIDYMRGGCDANYGTWSLMVQALLCEVKKDFQGALIAFEESLDHAQLHNWPIEEALAYELQVDFLIRRGAKRAAQKMLQPAISVWNRIGAAGKAQQLTEKYEWLTRIGTVSRSNDVGCQTIDSLLGVQKSNVTEPSSDSHAINSLEGGHNQNWLEQNQKPTEGPSDITGVGLDIIDLSTIIEFSHVMSSELEVNKLLTKMVRIILESCSGSEHALVITEFDSQGWCVAASGDNDSEPIAYENGLPFSDIEDKMAQQISSYTLRTREPVLVHNVLEDDRFSNLSEAYTSRHPHGRSIIVLPIIQAKNFLGVIHIEGKPNSFTQRNLVLLRLVCNQMGISLANAFLFQEVRKVSAANAAMVEAQKCALVQAREAEHKAKIAEVEANHNVKLKEDAAKAKSIFLANISHDLRTPMTGVIGLSELLKATKLDPKQDVYVESIRVCADTLLTLINDILDFSKLEAGKMKVSIVPINLRQTIAEVVRALRYTHREKGLETIEDLDSIDPNLLVMGDPVRLHQIFMNLLSNSYKFTPKGSVTVQATVDEDTPEKIRVTCKVADTGIGISEEQLVRLFRPFSQADSSTARSYGGSGLGLSICKAIIEDVLGGRIWLQSQEGVGTTVTFTLLFKKAGKDAVPKTPWSQESGQKQPHAHTLRDISHIPRDHVRICIAEDNPINQKIAVSFVHHLGLSSEVFSDGEQAVEALRQRSKDGNPFHIVLMDVQMPVLDGCDATRKIRQDPDPNVNEVLVIAMTASAIEGDREKCIDAGMNNYLAKPVRSDVLKGMLDRYLAPQTKSLPKRSKSSAAASRLIELQASRGPMNPPSPPLKDRIAEEQKTKAAVDAAIAAATKRRKGSINGGIGPENTGKKPEQDDNKAPTAEQ